MKKVKRIRPIMERAYLLPSLMTVSSLFAGYLSIISSIKGNYEHSINYIVLAFFLDGLDGGLARKLNAASDFGKEFDSLCDLVAFGVAPAILVWEWAFKIHFDEASILSSFLFVAGSATRLARFNVISTSEPKSYFVGLPTPAAAACLISVVYAFPEGLSKFSTSIVMIYAILIGGLMVSTFKFPSIKRFSVSKVDPRKVFLALAAVVAIAWAFNRLSVLLIFMGYILYSIYPSLVKYKKEGVTTENTQQN